MSNPNKDSIHTCDCQILAHYQFAGAQYILTLESDIIANQTKPGQFVHISVADGLLCRPISVMSVDVENGTFDLLYKVVGAGTQKLSERKIGEVLAVIGPIGNGFKITENKRPLLIGGGVGMPPMIAIAQQIKASEHQPFVILGSEIEFPFATLESKIGKNYQGAKRTMPLLEEWKIACRLASLQDYDGVFKGLVTDLAYAYLQDLSVDELAQVEIYCCGPEPMLKAVAKLAEEYNLPCQVSLEEYMACAVGGCAGCVVSVQTSAGSSMQRVCVDGPVFNARAVF
ncbi:MAG: dihydroorotate dehydrogenase electron transfer subunit [Candidatus Thioglobus sp.]|nr:MAG: dihydroorotate dehydrogenase electron transfer subunit [Candidatus Thioglobus sp.]